MSHAIFLNHFFSDHIIEKVTRERPVRMVTVQGKAHITLVSLHTPNCDIHSLTITLTFTAMIWTMAWASITAKMATNND